MIESIIGIIMLLFITIMTIYIIIKEEKYNWVGTVWLILISLSNIADFSMWGIISGLGILILWSDIIIRDYKKLFGFIKTKITKGERDV